MTIFAVWIHLCGVALLMGGSALLVELAPGSRAPRLVRTGATLAVIGQLAWLVSVMFGLLGDVSLPSADDLQTLLFRMPFGWVWLARSALLVVLVLRVWRHPVDRPAVVLALALAGSLALTGHAMSVGGGHAGHLAMHALHAIAACAWIGSLPFLDVQLRGNAEAARALLARYGAFGGACLVGLLVGGVATAVSIVWQTPQTPSGEYITLLGVKLGLLALMLLLAADNFLRKTPLAVAGDAMALKAIAANSRQEFGLGLAVLLVAAALAQTAP